MDLLDPDYVVRVMLIFARVSGLMIAAPVFSQRNVPVQIRVLFSVLLAFSVAGLIPARLPPYSDQALGIVLAGILEGLIGALIGFTARFIFWALQFAGELIGFQMALRMAKVFDPITGVSSNPIGRFLTMIMTLIFLLLDGHHLVIEALVGSFRVVPLAGANFAEIGPPLLHFTGEMFQISVRLAAPFMITIYLIDVALGLFVRAVPQADIFSVALPMKLMVGLLVAYLFVRGLIPTIPTMVETMVQQLVQIVEILTPA